MPAIANAALVIALAGLMLPHRAPPSEPRAELSTIQEAAVVEVATDLISRLAQPDRIDEVCVQVFSMEPPSSVITSTRKLKETLVPDSDLRVWPGSKCHIKNAEARLVEPDTPAAIVAILEINALGQHGLTVMVCLYFNGRAAIWWEYFLERKGDVWEISDRKKRGIS